MPIALIVYRMIQGQSIIPVIVGIISGHVYFFLKDIAPVQNKINILVTPKLAVDFSEKYVYPNVTSPEEMGERGFTLMNNNAGDRAGNTNNRPNNQQQPQQRGGFVPFSGRGHRLDE